MQLNAKGTHNRLTTVVSKCQFLITSALRSHLLWSLSYGNIPGMFGCDKHVIAVHSRASEKDPLLEPNPNLVCKRPLDIILKCSIKCILLVERNWVSVYS